MKQAYEIPNFYVGIFPAEINMSTEATYQFHAVFIGAASATTGAYGASLQMPAAGGNILGILQNNPMLGEAGQVMVEGISKATAGATISAPGVLLMTTTAGALIPATSGNVACAIALAAASSGDIIPVLLKNCGKQ